MRKLKYSKVFHYCKICLDFIFIDQLFFSFIYQYDFERKVQNANYLVRKSPSPYSNLDLPCVLQVYFSVIYGTGVLGMELCGRGQPVVAAYLVRITSMSAFRISTDDLNRRTWARFSKET